MAPVAVDEFRIGIAETYDVIVEPGDAAYAIFAQSEDRSGFAFARAPCGAGAMSVDGGIANGDTYDRG